MTQPARRVVPVALIAVLLPVAAMADSAYNNISLPVNVSFDLDAGTTTTSGITANPVGDIEFNGSSVTFLGSASGYTYSLGTTAAETAAYQAIASGASIQQQIINYGNSTAPIPVPSSGSVLFGVYTNGGYFGKVLLTVGATPSTVTITFDIYGAPGSGPTISAVQNNYSLVESWQPNYGIAPGSLFIVTGTNLAAPSFGSITLESSAAGLPRGLNGSAISVAVDGATTYPAYYYATPTQIAVVLPSDTPVGAGTVQVAYNSQASSFPITVAPSALGLAGRYGYSAGPALATDNSTGVLRGFTNSAAPGEVIDLWGSGLGADLADSDTTFTATPHAIPADLQVYVGGVLALINYQGASGYPGVNQIAIAIPQSAPLGCAVSVVAVSGGITSNALTLPIAAAKGASCSDPVIGIDGAMMEALASKTSYNYGAVSLSQATIAGKTNAFAGASLLTYPGPNAAFGLLSFDSCVVSGSTVVPGYTAGGLGAGALNVTGPQGTLPLPGETVGVFPVGEVGIPGEYRTDLPAGFIPSGGGSFTVTGGEQNPPPPNTVGAFQASITLGPPLEWTNMNAITSVTRSQGLTVTWSGGDPSSYVVISGQSGASPAQLTGFQCSAPISAGSFTVPGFILDTLSANGAPGNASATGSLIVQNYTPNQTFAAPDLDYGIAFGFSEFAILNIPFR